MLDKGTVADEGGPQFPKEDQQPPDKDDAVTQPVPLTPGPSNPVKTGVVQGHTKSKIALPQNQSVGVKPNNAIVVLEGGNVLQPTILSKFKGSVAVHVAPGKTKNELLMMSVQPVEPSKTELACIAIPKVHTGEAF